MCEAPAFHQAPRPVAVALRARAASSPSATILRHVIACRPAVERDAAVGAWHAPVFGRVGPPCCHVCHDRWPVRTCLACARAAANRRAVSGPRRPPLPLRGAASHEAEGRGGARGGGVGRVGPLAGWHRLRLLREILDELVPGVEQFLLMNNVVAVEDGPALVPGQEHGDALGDVRADQVARGGAAAIVEEAGRHPGRLAGGAPRRAPAADVDSALSMFNDVP